MLKVSVPVARIDHSFDRLQRCGTSRRDDSGATQQSGSIFVGGTTNAIS
jgi:hypothetical protein